MNKILIIKLGALGDVVMATPLLEAIAAHHPQDSLHVLTTAPYGALFAGWPRCAVTTVERRGWGNLLTITRWLRSMRFDCIYDLQGNDRSGIWCALSGAPRRVGNHSRYPYTHHPPTRWRGQCHIFERMTEVLASAGVGGVAPVPKLPCSDRQRQHVEAWLQDRRLQPRSFALLHAGASARRPAKIWPHFAALAARLHAAGVAVVWLGAEPDRRRNAELAQHAGIDATAAFDVPELAALGRSARFAVTNDSGPMHVLSAAQIPVFGLFGPSDWRRNHALGQGHRVIRCVDYDPRYKAATAGDCLAAVPVEAVWSKLTAEQLINR